MVQDKIFLDFTKSGLIKSDSNNWVVPGYVMAGPYPGLDGFNYPTEQDAYNNLNSILDDKIDTFINLCGELDEANTNIDHPYFPKYMSYKKMLAAHPNLKFYHFKLEDQNSVSDKLLIEILNTIMTSLLDNRRIFIHCAGGHGRTGMIVACLLQCLYTNMSVEQSLYFTQHFHNMRRKGDVRCKSHPIPVLSPNTSTQFALVRDFARFLRFVRCLL
jgi:hypothetical protein